MSTPDKDEKIFKYIKIVFWMIIYTIYVIKDKTLYANGYSEGAIEDLENQINRGIDK